MVVHIKYDAQTCRSFIGYGRSKQVIEITNAFVESRGIIIGEVYNRAHDGESVDIYIDIKTQQEDYNEIGTSQNMYIRISSLFISESAGLLSDRINENILGLIAKASCINIKINSVTCRIDSNLIKDLSRDCILLRINSRTKKIEDISLINTSGIKRCSIERAT